MRSTLLALTGAAALGIATSASAAVIVEDNFDSYSDTAAMQAVWGDAGLGTLVDATTVGGSGNAMSHNGGQVNSIALDNLAPTASTNVVLSGTYYDDGVGNKRISIGLRNGANPLFEFGIYNNPSGYATRIVNFPGASPSWVQIEKTQVEGWHSFNIEFGLDSITSVFDISSDGEDLYETTTDLSGDAWASGFGELRIGGPSNYSSTGGGLIFDNIKLETVAVPEPASLALLSLGALVALRRRK
ncbi:hypothetical protein KS4_33240 [Poriferisphaera corsica]|uniref:Ice-binding protein C-terminal domain-containing protein n=1 Tax=Poriferisphaera corsica TaxID=2528020 RepID=A0A517YYE2_9BACT|nr:PEP-CTERM sorting domain-containing protein [Poriferisphaera corsica]QDU35243.1 hypothetical protein KS4_33240 [Poriferisphaera corsica]